MFAHIYIYVYKRHILLNELRKREREKDRMKLV